MPTLISPSLNAASQTVAQSGPRGRDAEQPDGRNFGAMLDRSRAAGAAKAEASSDTAAPDAVASRKLARPGEKKSELTAADVMAMLAPLQAHFAPAVAQAKATATPADGTLASKGTQAVGAALDGLAADGTQAALPGDAATAAAATQEAGKASAPKAKAAAGQDVAQDDAQEPAQLAKTAAAAVLPAQAPAEDAAGAATPPIAGGSFLPKSSSPATSAASAKTGAIDATPVAAGADKAQPAALPAAIDAAKLAAAGPADNAPFDASATTDTPMLPQLQALAPAPVDRGAAPAASMPVLTVAAPVGSPEWGPAIGQQMIRMSASGHQVAELNLNPSGLGPLKVTLTMGDNQAQAMFVSAHEGVRKAVEAALPQLRSSLADQGISLGHTSVGAETRQPGGQQAAFAQQNPSNRSPNQPDYPGSGGSSDASAASARTAATAAAARSAGGLDTFA